MRRDERTSITTVRNAANAHSVIMLTGALACKPGDAPKLVFNRDGEGYELSEVRLDEAGCTYAAMGAKSKRASRERAMAAAVVMLQK